MKQIVKINTKDIKDLKATVLSFNLSIMRQIGDWMILSGNPSDIIAFEEATGISTYAPF